MEGLYFEVGAAIVCFVASIPKRFLENSFYENIKNKIKDNVENKKAGINELEKILRVS